MVRWRTCLLSVGILVGQDDALPPNFVYLEPIEDFYDRSQIELEIIVTDRNDIEEVVLYYRFNDDIEFSKQKMHVLYQPVIFNVVIPLDEVESGFIQYYFWAKDEYDNGATLPSGGEDMPMVLPVYPFKKEKGKTKVEAYKLVEGLQIPEELEDNLPYYLEIGIMAPFFEVNQEEGVPIVVLSVYDLEEIVDLESVKLLVDGHGVSSFNSRDMITYIPQDPFDPGYHIIRYVAKNNTGEILVKEFSFFMHEKIIDETEIKGTSWKDVIKFKGNLGWNTDYDQSPNRPIDSHKINSLVKFQLGEFKINLSGMMNTHIYDADAREEATHRQPSSRVKFKMNSPYIDFHYGDNTPEFSEFSLKGTRVRGISTKLRWGTWETSFVSGETKHWVNSKTTTNLINIWDTESTYQLGDRVYDNSITWIVIVENTGSEPCVFNEDTCAANPDWTFLEESEFSAISNDVCTAVEPAMYGLNPDTSRIGIAFGEEKLGDGGGFYWFWDGSSCKEELIYSSINMLTGEDGIAMEKLFYTYDACQYSCTVPVHYEKGSQIRYLQGFRTSKDFFEHAKFGISAIRSWDVRDENLTPYSIFHEGYTYEGNIAAAGDFSFHFNHDKTVLSGEYGLSMTIDQTFSDTLLLRNISKIPDSLSLYSYADWSGVDYCYQNECVDINGDGIIISAPEFVEGAIQNDTLWAKYTSAKNKMNEFAKTLGFALNDDINGYTEGRGVSGLTGPELGHLIDGGFDSLYLLLKRPAFKVAFKTPIPLNFTELNFQTEFNQAPLNYLSHGSSSIQTDVRNWKNKVAFKLLKNQVSFSFGYDKQIKSPWDPESDLDGEIKRSITDIKSGSISLSFRNLPGLNYSIRLQDRQDLLVSKSADGATNSETTGLKQLSTHTIAPTYKISLGKTNLNLNGNITFVSDLDLLSDQEGCFEILNNTANNEWRGVADTIVVISGDTLKCEGNYYYFTKENNPLRDSGNLTSTYTGAISFSFPIPLSMNLGWGISINSPNDFRQSKTVISVLSSKLGYKFFDKKLNLTIGGNYVIGLKEGNGFWDDGEALIIDRNGIWNPGEDFIDNNSNEKYDEGEIFIDAITNNIYDYLNSDQYEDWTDCIDDFSICEDGDNWDDETMGNHFWNEGETWIDEGANETYDPEDEFIDKVELHNSKLSLKFGLQYKIPEPNITIGLNLNYTKAVDYLKTEQDNSVFKVKLAIKFGF